MEKSPLAGIARAAKVSDSWLQAYVNLTSYIERLNNTLRQRISRLVRKTLSFSKKIENHIGAIWMFIHDYNRRVREKLAEREEAIFPSIFY